MFKGSYLFVVYTSGPIFNAKWLHKLKRGYEMKTLVNLFMFGMKLCIPTNFLGNGKLFPQRFTVKMFINKNAIRNSVIWLNLKVCIQMIYNYDLKCLWKFYEKALRFHFEIQLAFPKLPILLNYLQHNGHSTYEK